MKSVSLFLLFAAGAVSAQTTPSYVNFIRQNQQGTGVVWDMPVAAKGASQSALLLESGGSLFQLWTINQTEAKDYLLDQKLVGAYLPKASVKITTVDPYTPVVRTRVGQPFEVSIEVSDLLTGTGLPDAATKVLLQRHVASYPAGSTELNQATVTAGTPSASSYISQNGKTVLKFGLSSLTATDPTKASGEEHFVVHALSDGSFAQSQIASAKVQIWPIASGQILGLKQGENLRYQIPTIQLTLNDLYPRSDTYLMLYEGTAVNGTTGIKVKEFPWDSDKSWSGIIMVEDLSTKITKDGTYTLALVSKTVFGTELLDKGTMDNKPITFTVDRSIEVNAMQVNFTDPSEAK